MSASRQAIEIAGFGGPEVLRVAQRPVPVPGAGEVSPAHPKWRPLLKRIIAAGKRVHLGVAPEEIEELLSDVPADGLFISTWCASEGEARELLWRVEGWARFG